MVEILPWVGEGPVSDRTEATGHMDSDRTHPPRPPAPPSVHVVWSRSLSKWRLKTAGKYIAREYRTKRMAIAAGRDLARASRAELKIHNMDGRISDSVSYGNDPRGVPG